jgi:hypothetical protein
VRLVVIFGGRSPNFVRNTGYVKIIMERLVADVPECIYYSSEEWNRWSIWMYTTQMASASELVFRNFFPQTFYPSLMLFFTPFLLLYMVSVSSLKVCNSLDQPFFVIITIGHTAFLVSPLFSRPRLELLGQWKFFSIVVRPVAPVEDFINPDICFFHLGPTFVPISRPSTIINQIL